MVTANPASVAKAAFTDCASTWRINAETQTDGEERFRALFQYSPNVILVFDRDGVITDINVLKIDRSFVSGIGVQPSDETIVRAVLAMAHSLGLEAVAEGVETEAQLTFLRQHECDLVQGYVVAPALPAGKLEHLLLDRRGAAASAG